MLILLPPNAFSVEEIEDFRDEFHRFGSKLHGCEKIKHYDDITQWLNERPWTKSPHVFQFFSYDTELKVIVGCIRICTYLTAQWVTSTGNNIGYSIRPTMRGHRLAEEQLRLGLQFLYDSGVDTALVSADVDNIPSIRTIKHFEGVMLYSTRGTSTYVLKTFEGVRRN